MMNHKRKKRGIYWAKIKQTLAAREQVVNLALANAPFAPDFDANVRETLQAEKADLQEVRSRLARSLGK